MQVQRLRIRTPSHELVRKDRRPLAGAATAGVSWTPVRPLLADANDLAVLLERMPPPDDAGRREMKETIAGWRAVLGERGIVAPWGFAGVFNAAAEPVGMDRLYAMPFEEPDEYAALMEGLAAADYNAVLAAAGAAAVGIQGHIAGGQSVGPDFFRERVLPWERRVRVVGAIHAAGAFTVYHNCGHARSLYEVYRQLGMTA